MISNSEKTYLYKLIPDYSIIDYAEYKYWSAHSQYDDNTNGDVWYNIFKLNTSTFLDTNYYRMLVVSDNKIEFKNNNNQIIYELPKYQNRYVYVVFSDDENPKPISLKLNDINIISYYATAIRF